MFHLRDIKTIYLNFSFALRKGVQYVKKSETVKSLDCLKISFPCQLHELFHHFVNKINK